MSTSTPYKPPAAPGEPWNKPYSRADWDNRYKHGKPSQAALNRAYQNLEEHYINTHADWAEGFAYNPMVLAGLPDTQLVPGNENVLALEHEDALSEEQDLHDQYTTGEEQKQ